jgi:hypothetical protein
MKKVLKHFSSLLLNYAQQLKSKKHQFPDKSALFSGYRKGALFLHKTLKTRKNADIFPNCHPNN